MSPLPKFPHKISHPPQCSSCQQSVRIINGQRNCGC